MWVLLCRVQFCSHASQLVISMPSATTVTSIYIAFTHPAERSSNHLVMRAVPVVGPPTDTLYARLQDSGFQQVFDPIKVKFKPTAKDMQVAEESGTDLAQAIQKKQKAAQKQTSKQASTGASASPLLHLHLPACSPPWDCRCDCWHV